MKPDGYGVVDRSVTQGASGAALEQLAILGYCVVPDVLMQDQLVATRTGLDEVYQQQVDEVGLELLTDIGELDTARCPLAYHERFLTLAQNQTIVEMAHAAIGGAYVILNQQNGVLNRPDQPHHQAAWHRDLPYQHFVSSRPLAVSALYCLDDFTAETGGTQVLPHTHRFEPMPSADYCDSFAVQIEAAAGSVILLDSMIYHRAGFNRSSGVRRAVNNVYSVPILRQQIDLSAVLSPDADPSLRRLLDCQGGIPTSVREYRQRRKRQTGPT